MPDRASPRDELTKQLRWVHSRLDREPSLRPVADDEGLLFAAHDLASLAEVAFGETLNPLTLTGEAVEELARRLRCPVMVVDEYRRRYWITQAGQTVGTLAVDDHPFGLNSLDLSLLYLQPAWRGKALGRSVVDTVRHAAFATKAFGSVRLTADWLRPQSVQFYLHMGFRVSHWKHAIHMVAYKDAPALRFSARADRTWQLVAEQNGAEQLLLTADREGPWLRLQQHSPDGKLPARQLDREALATMAVHLALEGFPLIRDAERWEQAYRWSDGGQPEGLARRIWFFEEYARRCGHRVDTQRQVLPPGLAWPIWG